MSRTGRLGIIVGLLAGGTVIGSVLIGGAQAHVTGRFGHLWNKHIQERADARYLQQEEADGRYVQRGEAPDDEAYAYVNVELETEPVLMPGVRNFTDVYRATTGVYCLIPSPGFGLAGRVATATADWRESNGNDLLALWDADPSNCQDGELGIRTYKAASAGTATDEVSFSVFVP